MLVGAGPSGVELAASLAHLVKVTLRGNFHRIDPTKASIILLDAGKRVLPTFAELLSRRVSKRLKKLGVKVTTDVKVEKVDEQGVIAGGTRIPSATVLWTAGVAASPIPKMLGTKTDRAGRALVDPFLKIVDAPGVFVVGDAASVMQNEHPVPGVAQAAIQEGRYVGRLIAKELKGRKVKRPFRYFDKGNMAVVGKNYAVLERGWLRTSGFLTWLVWAFVHILSLPQLQNRLRVQRQWFWSYFTGQRSSRRSRKRPGRSRSLAAERIQHDGLRLSSCCRSAGRIRDRRPNVARVGVAHSEPSGPRQGNFAGQEQTTKAVQAVHRRGIEALC